ncbi:MAG: carbon-nitrogen hydrolase family protein [Thermoproteota archaeon]|jgi:predicted amidohydrolase|nr:carbon-nitrogen hydrolase family protein [Thermoproteota archaeon]
MLRIALIQPNSKGDKEEVLKRVMKLIEEASKEKAEIACLPEHWIISYNFDEILKQLSDSAKKYGISIITGGNYIKNKEITEVASFLIDESGEIIGSQRKIHLFGAEKEVAVPGDEYNVFNFKDTRIAISICHDLVYPEAVRILVLKGAELIFAPARIKQKGFDPWKLYVLTRALENRVHIATINALLPPMFLGNSFVVDFKIEEDVVIPFIYKELGSEEGFIVVDIDPKKVEKFRKERLAARRVSTYSPILTK